MIIELHALQNFAPSNLNRDDTGSPKDCEFGGYRRARISSQCLKRAMRVQFRRLGLINPEDLATRTKRLADEIARRLETRGKLREQAMDVTMVLIRSAGLDFKNRLSEYLLFLSEGEIEKITRTCAAYWDELAQAASEEDARKSVALVPPEATAAVAAAFASPTAADLALFGRMIADKPQYNVEAAAQVAHALSTNRVNMEFDFYTAVDDLRPLDNAGSDMLGVVEFNSATFYRYASLDVNALASNLRDKPELARDAAQAFMRAWVDAVPSGHQHNTAAHNRPSFVMATVRRDAPCSLANAFLQPVQPTHDADLMQLSIARLDGHWNKLMEMYGAGAVIYTGVATLEPERLTSLRPHLVAARAGMSQVDTLLQQTLSAAFEPETRHAGRGGR